MPPSSSPTLALPPSRRAMLRPRAHPAGRKRARWTAALGAAGATLSAALALGLSAPTTAAADPAHDFAGSRTPSALTHTASAARLHARPATLAGPIGPDVSRWQGCGVRWSAVAGARTFAFAKASEGPTYTDPCFATNWRGMQAAGLARGAYDFARPRAPISSARREARHFVAVVESAGGFAGSLPPVLDVEANRGLGRSALRRWIQAWIDEVRAETGRYVVTIYTGAWFWNPNVGAWAPPGALLWASGYTSAPPRVAGFGPPSWWQYTDGTFGLAPHSSPGLGRADHSVWLGTGAGLSALRRR